MYLHTLYQLGPHISMINAYYLYVSLSRFLASPNLTVKFQAEGQS